MTHHGLFRCDVHGSHRASIQHHTMVTGLREDSPVRRRWDMCSLVLAIVSMVLVSFQFVFQHRVGLVGSLIVYAIGAFFVIDIVFNFRTTYRRIGAEITDPGMIARRCRQEPPAIVICWCSRKRSSSASSSTIPSFEMLSNRFHPSARRRYRPWF